MSKKLELSAEEKASLIEQNIGIVALTDDMLGMVCGGRIVFQPPTTRFEVFGNVRICDN
jgi:hypothetical protein